MHELGPFSRRFALRKRPVMLVLCGFFQSVRRLKEETIEANYDEVEVIEILGFSDAIGMLTALQIALMAGNVELANDLLEKSKTELKKP